MFSVACDCGEGDFKDARRRCALIRSQRLDLERDGTRLRPFSSAAADGRTLSIGNVTTRVFNGAPSRCHMICPRSPMPRALPKNMISMYISIIAQTDMQLSSTQTFQPRSGRCSTAARRAGSTAVFHLVEKAK